MIDSETVERLLEHGFHVFPVSKYKTPLTPNGWKDATNNIDTLTEMFESYKDRDPQIGIACEYSNLFVLDVDRKQDKDGFAALTTLQEQHGPLPPTVLVTTPNNGVHFYFRGFGRSTAGTLGVGLDTRSK